MDNTGPAIESVIGGILLLAFVGILYFLPSIGARGTRHSGPILLVNLFLGWTLIGWLGCMVWAYYARQGPDPRDFSLCPACGHRVSRLAPACPRCGHPLAAVAPGS